MLLRFVIAWLAVWVIYPKWFFNPREEIQFVILSLVGNTLYYLFENTALRLTLASNVSILVSAAPIASALMMRLFVRDERLSRRQIAGIGIAFFGVLFVVFNGVFILIYSETESARRSAGTCRSILLGPLRISRQTHYRQV